MAAAAVADMTVIVTEIVTVAAAAANRHNKNRGRVSARGSSFDIILESI